jgi:hypothetical protein
VVLLVVTKWMAAITGDGVGLFLDFSLRRKIWGTIFQGGSWKTCIFSLFILKH